LTDHEREKRMDKQTSKMTMAYTVLALCGTNLVHYVTSLFIVKSGDSLRRRQEVVPQWIRW